MLQAHHDGSPGYLDNPRPELGDAVRVRLHVPHRADGTPAADDVAVRAVHDGEARFFPATRDAVDEMGTWWTAEFEARNPVTPYRFLLTGGADGYRWVNAGGTHARDVTDGQDFKVLSDQRLPDWVPDAIGYQVFPDRFERTETGEPVPDWAVAAAWGDRVVHQGPDTARQFFGGTLDGVRQRLDHLTGLGVNLLYLTPMFPARSNHRYDASSFDHVDPLLGGDAAFVRLVTAAHDAGIRVVGDLTTNHTGAGHEWFERARSEPDSPERHFYHFTGKGIGYEAWWGHPSLPKLDHSSEELRRRFYAGPESTIARWLERGLDGWRIDVANMTGRLGRTDLAHEVAAEIRRTMAATDPQAWLLAEHGHDASTDLVGSGWQGTMNYLGFTKPMWTWLGGGRSDLPYLGQPCRVPELDGRAAVATMRDVLAAMSWSAWQGSTMHLDSHDTPRFRTVVGGGSDGIDQGGSGRDRHLAGLAMQFSLPGVPMLFMGDEIGLRGVDGEHARTPFPWDRAGDWDAATLAAYRSWIRLRREHVALRQGSLRWLAALPDALVFLREHPDETLVVHVARAPHEGPLLTPRALGSGRLVPLMGERAVLEDGGHRLPGDGPGASVHLVTRD